MLASSSSSFLLTLTLTSAASTSKLLTPLEGDQWPCHAENLKGRSHDEALRIFFATSFAIFFFKEFLFLSSFQETTTSFFATFFCRKRLPTSAATTATSSAWRDGRRRRKMDTRHTGSYRSLRLLQFLYFATFSCNFLRLSCAFGNE